MSFWPNYIIIQSVYYKILCKTNILHVMIPIAVLNGHIST
jgi:hypothetical protein